jgi:sugar lactone lactonase YvrE
MQAEFQGMHNLARTRDGRLYLADTFNHAIRLYDPATQTVATIAGNGQPGFAGDDGPVSPETVQFRQPICIALNDEETQLFIADIGNRRVRVMDLKTNQIRTIAGNGQKGVPQDGQPAREQPLTDPRAVSQDRQGRLYILERGGHRLYRLEPDGKILAVAGTGKPGRTGDGGPALQAAMNGPKYLVCDANGLVLIADTENHQIRAFDPEKQTLRTLVGTGQPGAGGLGQGPLQVQLKRPHGVVRHPKTGELWIADSDNQRILRVAVP